MIGSRQGSSGPEAYRLIEGVGATPDEFMKMGLDAARALMLRAEAAMRAGDRTEKARALNSAGNVVEFMLGLSGAAPGALSDCLASVYQYVLAAILRGNAEEDGEAVAAGRLALEELAATWRTIFPDLSAWNEIAADGWPTGRDENA